MDLSALCVDVCDGVGLEPEGDDGGSWVDFRSAIEADLLSRAAPAVGGPPAIRRAAPVERAHGRLERVGSGQANERPLPVKKGELVSIPGFGFTSKRAAPGDGNCGVADGTGDMGQGMNMDKRRSRQVHRESFVAGIATHRQQQQQPQQQGGDADAPSCRSSSSAPPAEAGAAAAGCAVVQAWVRKRPLLAHELEKGEYDAVTVARTGRSVTTHCCLMKSDLRRLFLRHACFAPSGGVFDECAHSSAVYAHAARPLLELALGGGHGTLLFYGQTGSGKTMTASHVQAELANELFGRTDGALAVEVTALEVSGKKVKDLSSKQECLVFQTASGGAEVRGVVPHIAADAQSLRAFLDRVMAARTTRATAANATSSRSHAIISLVIGTRTRDDGRLTLVDCAGSEWAADSAAHDAHRRQEGAQINASLHALKQCVRAHAQRSALASTKAAAVRVPYREALLTRLLRECFEGDGGPPPFGPQPKGGGGGGGGAPAGGAAARRLVVVGCVSPGATDTEHSTSTLRTVMELAATSGEQCVTSTQDVPRVKHAAGEQQATPRVE